MRDIHSRNNGSPARRRQRAGLIVNHGIAVDCHPVAHKRQPVGKIKRPMPGAGIARSPLVTAGNIISAGKTAPERAKRQRRLTLSGEYSSAGKTKFQVLCGLEADLVAVEEGVRREVVPGKSGEEVVIAKRAKQPG